MTTYSFDETYNSATFRTTKHSTFRVTTKRSCTAFGMEFPTMPLEAMAEEITDNAARGKRTRIAFVNAHCINEMSRSRHYDRAVRSANLILPDGSGIALATMMQSGQPCTNLNGTDLTPLLFKEASKKRLSVFLLGARPGVAEEMRRRVLRKFPDLKIAGVRHGYFKKEENDEVIETINASNADIVLVAFGVPYQDVWLAENAARLNAPVAMGVGGLFDFLSGRIPRAPRLLRQLGLEWTWRLSQEPARMWRRYIVGNPEFMLRAAFSAARSHAGSFTRSFDAAARRALDIVGAGMGLLLLTPLLLAVAVAIRLESSGEALFRQTRVGKDGKPFTMFKFRSMCKDAEALRGKLETKNQHGAEGVTFKIDNDPRITPIGKFIRKFSIDELPQLWNVLIGDMSLVGPRPALPVEVARYSEEDSKRLAVKPGITCLWQIEGRADIDFKGQVALDVEYIKNQNLLQDLIILVRTPMAVVTARGAY